MSNPSDVAPSPRLTEVQDYAAKLHKILDGADRPDAHHAKGFGFEQTIKLEIAQSLIRDRIAVVSGLLGHCEDEDERLGPALVEEIESTMLDLGSLKGMLDVTQEDRLDAVIAFGGIHGKASGPVLNPRIEESTRAFVVDNLILRRGQYFGPAHWSVLLGIAVKGESTFASLHAWSVDEVGVDVSSSSMRDAVRVLDRDGYILQVGSESSSKGPPRARYGLTKEGRRQIENARGAPMLRST